jgi:hypothetical protein
MRVWPRTDSEQADYACNRKPIGSNLLVMKTCTMLKSAVLAVILGLWFCPSSFAQEKSEPVKITKDSITIPGTEITKEDQKEIDAILAKYDKSLYKIQIYKNGTLKKTKGSLSQLSVAAAAVADVVKAKAKGLSNWTIEITGLGCETSCIKQSPTPPQAQADQEALKKRLRTIFEKYSK